MLALETGNFVTAESIALKVGCSERAVNKRLSKLDNSFIKYIQNPSGTGRPLKVYSLTEALAIYNINLADIQKADQIKVIRKVRNDRGGSRKIAPDIEQKLRDRTLELYLQQGNKKYIRPCCMTAAREIWSMSGGINGFKDATHLGSYFYKDRVYRKDKNNFVGYYWSEKWSLKWDKRSNVVKASSEELSLRWDYVKFLTSAGVIGKGFGAADLWVIDATQFDSWVLGSDGKPYLQSYLAIVDGVTQFPLMLHPISSENIAEIGSILLKCLKIYGVPRFGVMLDNSRTFRSGAIQNLIKAFYKKTQLEELDGYTWYREAFGGQTGPVLFPLPKQPRHSFKAVIEQFFNQANKHQALYLAGSYQGSTAGKMVKYELGSVPTYQLAHAPEFAAAWKSFIHYIYDDKVHRASTSESLKSFRQIVAKDGLNMVGSPWEAFCYYGGLERTGCDIPEENQALAFYWLAPKQYHHTVKARNGYCLVTHGTQAYQYMSRLFNDTLNNDKVVCIPNPQNLRQAFIYKEIYKTARNKAPELVDVEYLGEAKDSIIRDVADLHLIHEARAIRTELRKIAVEKDAFIENIHGWEQVIDDDNLIEPGRHSLYTNSRIEELNEIKQIEEREYVEILSQSEIDDLLTKMDY